MKRLLVFYFILFFQLHAEFQYRPFDDAMSLTAFDQQEIFDSTTKKASVDGKNLYYVLKESFENNVIHIEQPSEKLKIPKIIHQIWIGPSFPAIFKPLMRTWIKFHKDRGWLYKLWTDEDIPGLNLITQLFFDATRRNVVKADILRLELLYRYGGVYIDVDFECLHALDFLHYACDFYVGTQPLDIDHISLGSALIGARPGHPIIAHAIKTIPNDWRQSLVVNKVGPLHLTRSFYYTNNQDGYIDVAFPSSYFYPVIPYKKEGSYSEFNALGSLAVHHWAATWVTSHDRVKLIEYKK